MTTKLAYQLIKKEVGVNGIMAIKADRMRCGCGTNFYQYLKKYKTEFDIHSLIYCHITMIKPFAQYTNY